MAAHTLKGFAAKVPDGVLAIWDRLLLAAPSYLVGGAVRDLLLGRIPKDYDIATALMPDGVVSVLGIPLSEGGRFGSLRVPGLPLEVVSMREEAQYGDRRRPNLVRFGATLEADLGRRDFTVNAMALSRAGDVIDPHQGLRDLELRRLRTVGDARGRLSEDLLRVLRAYRFAAELGFSLTPGARKAARELSSELGKIAPERIGQELVRLLGAESAVGSIRMMARDGVLAAVLPSARLPQRDYPGRLLRLLALYLGADPAAASRELAQLGWPSSERVRLVRAARLAQALRSGPGPADWRRALAEAGTEAGSLLVQVGGREFVRFARLFGREGVIDRTRLPLRGAELAAAEGLAAEEIGRRERALLEELWRRPRA